MKKFAKLVSFVLALVLMVSLTSCGNEPSETSGNSDIQNSGNSDEPIVLKLAWAETADPKVILFPVVLITLRKKLKKNPTAEFL